MIDKGHCFMTTESFEEYVDYYDFSKKRDLSNVVIQEEQEGADSDWENVDESDDEEEKGDKKKESQLKDSTNSNKIDVQSTQTE